MYKLFFLFLNPNNISHSPLSYNYKVINIFIKIQILIKKIYPSKIISYDLGKQIKSIYLSKYDFKAFKVEDLMNLEELIMIKYYFLNREKYKNFYDLGANIGLHSIIAKKLGLAVKCYEPDKEHFNILKKNFQLNFNNNKKVTLINKAIYNKKAILSFIKVKNNTTANHIRGFKKNLYGPLETLKINAINLNNHLKKNSLIKMDIEGSENIVLKSFSSNKWKNIDCMVSVHNKKVAKDIYNHFKNKKINLFSSKLNWKLVKNFNDIPKCHADGLLFISTKRSMNWGS